MRTEFKTVLDHLDKTVLVIHCGLRNGSGWGRAVFG